MDEGDASHAEPPRRRWLGRTAASLSLALVAGAGVAWWYDVPDRLWGPDPATEPAAVEPPSDLALPEPAPAEPVAVPAVPGGADRGAVARAVQRLAAAPRLGRDVTVAVADLGGEVLYESGPATAVPASTLKLLGAAAALHTLGPDHRFATTVVRSGRRVVLVGGGDPLLEREPGPVDEYPERADLATLADRTARALLAGGVSRVRLGYDTSLFTGPVAEETWESDYLSGNVVSPIVPLWVDQGRAVEGFSGRSPDPAAAAAEVFATALRRAGVAVAGTPAPETAGPGMTQVAAVVGAPLAQVVQRTLELSDNEASEVLNRHVAIVRGQDPSFSGGATAVTDVLAELGVPLRGARLYDGSGLSRANRLAADSILAVLDLAAAEPRLRTVLSGLPVAGFNGSLASRFTEADPEALGQVRAKTGTLTGVNGLAGTVTTADGALLSFVAIVDRVRPVNTLFARAQLDRIAAALATCACR